MGIQLDRGSDVQQHMIQTAPRANTEERLNVGFTPATQASMANNRVTGGVILTVH